MAMTGLSQAVSAQSLAIDWVVSDAQLEASTVEHAFDHQVRWDFLIGVSGLVRANADVIGEQGERLAPEGTLFYAMRATYKTYCSLAASGGRDYRSRRKRICLIDNENDGTFDRYAVGEYRQTLEQAVQLEDYGELLIVEAEQVRSAQDARTLDGTMYVTFQFERQMAMQLFIDGRSYNRLCNLQNQAVSEDDSVRFECGVPGLIIGVQNMSLERKSRRVDLQIPTSRFSLVFERLTGVSFF